MRRNVSKKGFTLVEILIVVIILGILAAIIIPQFTDASNEARDSSLQSSLQTLRSQLELYKVQHLDAYPSTDDADVFVANMTTKTDETGAAGGELGPYFNKFPANPFSAAGTAGIRFVADGDEIGTGDAQWVFNTTTGQVFADDSADHSAY